jgi:hypothetical protein
VRSVYDNDPADIAEIGWEKFVTGIWESIFVGYQTGRGVRTLGRRWSDLLQGGTGCSEELADELVRLEIMQREDRAALRRRDPLDMLAAMDEVLADMGQDLAELDWIRPGEPPELTARLARLRRFLRESGADEADASNEAD